jgi:hypothetical protein
MHVSHPWFVCNNILPLPILCQLFNLICKCKYTVRFIVVLESFQLPCSYFQIVLHVHIVLLDLPPLPSWVVEIPVVFYCRICFHYDEETCCCSHFWWWRRLSEPVRGGWFTEEDEELKGAKQTWCERETGCSGSSTSRRSPSGAAPYHLIYTLWWAPFHPFAPYYIVY